MNPAMKEWIESFQMLSTPCVSDAMDKLHLEGGCLGIVPIVPGTKMVGPAFTARLVPVASGDEPMGNYLDEAQEGEVVVIDNGGRSDCAAWGDILSLVAVRNKLAGTVIDGACRDVGEVRKMGYPLFGTNVFSVNARGRVTLESTNKTVTIGKRRVRPGDLIMGDDSGVVVIPQDRVEEVLRMAQQIDHNDRQIVDRIKEGASLASARGQVSSDKW